MTEPITSFDEMTELLQENGYSVEAVNNFSTYTSNRFTVELEIENLNYDN